MRKYLVCILCGILFSALSQPNGRACTTFQLNDDGRIFVGTNYDWGVPDGLIIVNPRGLSKTAMPSYRDNSEVGRPAVWTSKYGSITFNQYGREMSFGGMNEAGLTIGTMGLFDKNKFPAPDSRPSVYMQQWLQYQLDNHARVEEVIQSESHLRIRPKKGVHIHFLISDQDGNCCVIEYIDGKQVIHANETMPHKVLTNSTYDDSLEYLAKDETPNPDRFKSIERFIRAANSISDYQSEASNSPLEYSFDLLKSVSWTAKRKTWTSRTQWSIVYDVNNLQIYFRTFANQEIRSINVKAINFSCAAPVKVLDVNADLSGDVTDKFVDYSRQMNRDLTANAFNKTAYLPQLPDKVFNAIAQYPDTFVCEQ
jgi:penicillin V acylase-like amidase (Ntn superfamily)